MTNVWGERLAAVCAMLFAGYMGYIAWDFPVGGHMFPIFVTAMMGFIALGMLIMSFVRPGEYEHGVDLSGSFDDLKPLIFTGLVFLYFLAIFQVGYFTSTLVFLLATPFILGLNRPVVVIVAAILAVLFIYVVFELALVARLPQGMLV